MVEPGGKPHPLEHAPGPLLLLVAGRATGQELNQYILQRRALWQEMMFLENESNPFPTKSSQFGIAERKRILARQVDRTGGRWFQRSQNRQQSAFP